MLNARGSGSGLLADRQLLIPLVVLIALLGNGYYHAASSGIWLYEEYRYAPFLVLTAYILLYRQLKLEVPENSGYAGLLGNFLLFSGALGYAVGHSQGIVLLDLAAGVMLLAGFICLASGCRAVGRVWCSLLLLLLAVPYPSWLLYTLTSPLKVAISFAVENLLYSFGYPVGRSGVVLAVGSYRLLVADACSGLHSLIFLAAIGLIYLQVTGPRKGGHNGLLLCLLVPIGIFANFVRVLALVLITYHFGDQAGQGLWHALSGMLLFASAFISLFVIDTILQHFSSRKEERKQSLENAAPDQCGGHDGRICSWRSCFLTVTLVVTLAGGELLRPHTPRLTSFPDTSLELLIPNQINRWQKDLTASTALVTQTRELPRQYNQTLNRTYVNEQGYRIMLSVAYGRNQVGSEFQVHRPESCYRAQGFDLVTSTSVSLPLEGQELAVRRLIARKNARIEPISYWMTIADRATLPGVPRKLEQLRFGLSGIIPDGMLIRISSIDGDPRRAFQAHQDFISDLRQLLPNQLGFAANGS